MGGGVQRLFRNYNPYLKYMNLILYMFFAAELVWVLHIETTSYLWQCDAFCCHNIKYCNTCLLWDSMGKNASVRLVIGATVCSLFYHVLICKCQGNKKNLIQIPRKNEMTYFWWYRWNSQRWKNIAKPGVLFTTHFMVTCLWFIWKSQYFGHHLSVWNGKVLEKCIKWPTTSGCQV